MTKVFQFRIIPDKNVLTTNQNTARSYITEKLNHFILCYDCSIDEDSFNAKRRRLFMHTLKMAWITDTDLFNFYIAEFDSRAVELGMNTHL